MEDVLIGVYKEVGKDPIFKKIENSKSEIENLIGGEIETIKYNDYVIVYKKNSDSMLANICIEPKGYGLGISLKGKLFAINQNENGDFKSLTKKQATHINDFFKNKQVNYENFDEKGRYLSITQKRKRNNSRKLKSHQKEIQKQNLDIDNDLKIESNREMLLELIKSIEKGSYTISFSDKLVLKMILKIQLIILEILNRAKIDTKE